MKLEQVKKLENPLTRLIYWINERETIRKIKELYDGEEKPSSFNYTNDEILQKYRFCNVIRMDDKVSKWLYTNWYEPYFNHPNMLLACTLARFINYIPSLKLIGFPQKWDANKIVETLREVKKTGKVFSPAYIINGNKGADKLDCVINYNCAPISKKKLLDIVDPISMERTHRRLLPQAGFASFMAGQVVADLRWAVKGTWDDRLTWAPIGPGSNRGMLRLQCSKLNEKLTQQKFLGLLLSLRKEIKGKIDSVLYDRMELMDLQNCLCEFDKYERTLWGEGKPKQLYKPNQL